jgi:hypothetical protein
MQFSAMQGDDLTAHPRKGTDLHALVGGLEVLLAKVNEAIHPVVARMVVDGKEVHPWGVA